MPTGSGNGEPHAVQIGPLGPMGYLGVPRAARGLIIFAHGSGSGRLSPRNQFVAAALRRAGFATLLLDLLTSDEEADRANVFDIPLLARRLAQAANWASEQPTISHLPIGFFGASTGAGAALIAAARPDARVRAIVSRGGRPDLAGAALARVQAPTLLIVGSRDVPVAQLNAEAFARLDCVKRIVTVAGATHLFEEPGTLDEVIRLAADWFGAFLCTPADADHADVGLC